MKKLRIFLLLVLAFLLIAAAPGIVSRQVEGEPMTPEALAAIVGMVVSLLASYVPGFNTWFAGIQDEYKKLIMLGILVVTCVVLVALSCTNTWIFIECTREGIKNFITVFVWAVIGNQAAFKIFPQPRSVREAKL